MKYCSCVNKYFIKYYKYTITISFKCIVPFSVFLLVCMYVCVCIYVLQQKKLLLQVFLFERPDVFFEVVKTLLMVISAYNAFWLVNFLSISKSGWKVCMYVCMYVGVFSYIQLKL